MEVASYVNCEQRGIENVAVDGTRLDTGHSQTAKYGDYVRLKWTTSPMVLTSQVAQYDRISNERVGDRTRNVFEGTVEGVLVVRHWKR